VLIYEIYILIFCNWNYLLVRYFSNPKLVFRNKYVTSLPSFNISFERCQSSKYFFTRDCRSGWPNLLLFKCIISWILKILSNLVTEEYHDVLFIECSFLFQHLRTTFDPWEGWSWFNDFFLSIFTPHAVPLNYSNSNSLLMKTTCWRASKVQT
jgi:hypothetical protein